MDSQNSKFLTALGAACSISERPPAPTPPIVGVEERGGVSRGSADIRQGKHHDMRWPLMSTPMYSAQYLKETKEVSDQPELGVCSCTGIQLDSETSADMEGYPTRISYPPAVSSSL